MLQLWVFYGEDYQRLEIKQREFTALTIGPAIEHDVTVQSFPFLFGEIRIEKKENQLVLHDGAQELGVLTEENGLAIEQSDKVLKVFVSSLPVQTKTYFIDYTNEVSFDSHDEQATFHLKDIMFPEIESGHFSFNKINDGWIIKKDFACPLYLNGKRCDTNQTIQLGDVLQWAFMEIKLVQKDLIEVVTNTEYISSLPEIELPKTERYTMYPEYRRTPRMIYDLPEDKVSISFPAQESDATGRGLLMTIALPLVMLIAIGTITIFVPRGIFVIISITMFMAVLVTSTINFFKERKREKKTKQSGDGFMRPTWLTYEKNSMAYRKNKSSCSNIIILPLKR